MHLEEFEAVETVEVVEAASLLSSLRVIDKGLFLACHHFY
jgi:hypothetical protein